MLEPTKPIGAGSVQADATGPTAGSGSSEEVTCLRGQDPDGYQRSKSLDPNRFIRPTNKNVRLRRAIAEALEKQRRGSSGPVAGEQWINRSQFSPLSSKSVLRRLVRRVREQALLAARGEAAQPVVIFDLDHTVYDNADRMLKVLHDWTKQPSARKFTRERRAIRTLQRNQVCYGITDCVRQAGIDDAQADAITRSVLPYFGKQFFDNQNTLLDKPYAGVLEQIQELVDAGAKIVFLTGRCEDEQGPGTREVLERDGLGLDNETFHLFLKPTKNKPDGSKLSDEEFKRSIADEIDAIGEIIGTLDNEPANVAVFAELYPEAMNIFVETAWSDNPAEPKGGLYKVDRFDD